MNDLHVVGNRLYRGKSPVEFRPSPNVGGECRPRWLVMHFTAGGFEGAVETLCSPAAKVSAHFVIDEDGRVVQLVPLDRVAWHAGLSEWRGDRAMNTHSIGIELANYGELAGRPGAWRFGRREVPAARVIVARHKNGGPAVGWHTYPNPQILAAIDVAAALHAAFGFEDIVGHDDIAPTRKTDPGPAFPMATFRATVLGSSAPGPVTPPVDVTPPPSRPPGVLWPILLQQGLNAAGFGPLVVDGDVGPATRRATAEFQRRHGLTPDGIAGPLTWAALEAAMKGTKA